MPVSKKAQRVVRYPWLLLLGIGACTATLFVAPEYPPKNAQPGFDEGHYLHLIRFGWASITSGSTPTYYATKSLPFLIVNALNRYENRGWDFPAYYRDMIFLNCLYLGFTAWVVFRILTRHGMKEMATIALILLLCNRAFLNFYIFYPRLPDVFSLGVSALFLWGHFAKRSIAVWASLLMSAVANPQLTLFILLCIALPAANGTKPQTRPARAWWTHPFWAVVMGVPVILFGLWAVLIRPDFTVAVAERWQNPKYFKEPVVLAVSVVAAALSLWFASTPLGYWKPTDIVRSLALRETVIAVSAIALITWYIGHVATNDSRGSMYLVRGLAIKMSYILSKPAPGVTSYIIFYGLVATFVLLVWRDFCRWVAAQGPGFTLAFCVAVAVFGLDGEVRHVIFLVPLAVVGLCHVAAEALKKMGPTFLIWASFFLSLNWIVFLNIDPGYRGERQLSAFGMCWSPIHYAAAITISLGTIGLFWTRIRLGELEPGNGRKATIRGYSYDEIWDAALRVTNKHFEIREKDRVRGVITLEHGMPFMGGRPRIAVFIVPSQPDAGEYIVEVVVGKELKTGISGAGWERKLHRDLQLALESSGKPPA